jgi:hypothetical protein
MRRFVFLFPAFVALASVLVMAAIRRSASVRERLGRIELGEWLETVRPQRVEIENVQP